MKRLARGVRLRRITERVAARMLCAAVAEAKGKEIDIYASLKVQTSDKPRPEQYVRAMHMAQREAETVRDALEGLLEGFGIVVTWAAPVLVKHYKQGEAINIEGETDMAMDKDIVKEVKSIRASEAQRRAKGRA